MVSVGDKISISKTKTGYIGSKSGNPIVGNKIGNNEFGWKSGNPAVGNKIVINKDNQGRYLGWKSGGNYLCQNIIQQTINVTNSYKVCDAVSIQITDTSLSGANYYGTNGWNRDSDHVWAYGDYTSEITFTANINGTNRYWMSSAPASLYGIVSDDDFTTYINGTRTSLRKYDYLGSRSSAFDITDYLVNGSNTFKMYFKDWYSSYFAHDAVYILELDMTNNYTDVLEFNKAVIFNTTGIQEHWTKELSVVKPPSVLVYLSHTPFGTPSPCGYIDNAMWYYADIYIDDVLTLPNKEIFKYQTMNPIRLDTYMQDNTEHRIKIRYFYGPSTQYLNAISQSWLYFTCP